jgi:hypothetical protein
VLEEDNLGQYCSLYFFSCEALAGQKFTFYNVLHTVLTNIATHIAQNETQLPFVDRPHKPIELLVQRKVTYDPENGEIPKLSVKSFH